jgi:hypothetical protein
MARSEHRRRAREIGRNLPTGNGCAGSPTKHVMGQVGLKASDRESAAHGLPRAATYTTRPRSNVVTAADCYRGEGRGEDRETAGVKHAEVITARLVQDERGWLRLAG